VGGQPGTSVARYIYVLKKKKEKKKGGERKEQNTFDAGLPGVQI
jgi:hypothetical protein